MLWFGGLILISLAAVVAGLLAAWRAFGEQQRLNALKTNFVSSVSHELRTPIASVRMMAEELCDMAAPDVLKSRQYHGFMAQECRRLTGLIENVLDFARMDQGRKTYDFEPTNLLQLVESTARTWGRYAADKSVRLSTSCAQDTQEIEADGQALQQVLANLLDNAIKYSPKGALVEVGVEPRLGDTGEPLGVRIWIQDQGPGIPLEEQTRIFDRFYRSGSELRRETQGVGLGLAIARGIVEAHHGQIEVSSTPPNGSRFIVDLPLEQTALKQPT
jgi:signal transduction histidine kinase